MNHEHKKRTPREFPLSAAAAAGSAADKTIVSPHSGSSRKVDSLRIEPAVELHRSSSGRNIRLKHSKPSVVPSPNRLTPRAPEHKRPPDPPARQRSSSSAYSPSHHHHHHVNDEDEIEFELKLEDPETETATAPSPNATGHNNNSNDSNQESSVTKPCRRSSKREDRRSSFMIPENVLEQLGYVRSSTPEPENQDMEDDLEEKAAVPGTKALTQIQEYDEERTPPPPPPPPSARQQSDPARTNGGAGGGGGGGGGGGVFQFELWKKAGRNRRFVDAVSGYDSAPSPTKPSPPKPSPPKRRSISADRSMEGTVGDVYEVARTLAAAKQGFGRQHHSVDIASARSQAQGHHIDASNCGSGGGGARIELSLTRSTSPIIGGGNRSSVRPLAMGDLPSCGGGGDEDGDQEKTIVKWKRGELLGEGTFGKVYRALNSETGESFAMKEIEIRARANADEVRQVQKLSEEIENMHKLRHAHIVRYKGSHRTDKYLYIFMEYVPGGSIASMLTQFDKFDAKLIRRFTRQIVQGVAYLHEMGIVHRDIKGANVLVSEQGVAKLADFGCSKQLPDIITTSLQESLRSIRGSIPWMAPEVVKQTGHGFKADVWSIGATVIEMATGRHPWPEMTNGISGILILAKATSSPPIPDGLCQDAKSFLARCFCIDPDERASAVELMQHPFLRKR